MNDEQSIREIQARYRAVDHSLNERQRRLWAATEALKRGRGGIAQVSKALRISPNTIKRGIEEIKSGQGDANTASTSRIRKPGGGRKSRNLNLNRSPDPISPNDTRRSEIPSPFRTGENTECPGKSPSDLRPPESSADHGSDAEVTPNDISCPLAPALRGEG